MIRILATSSSRRRAFAALLALAMPCPQARSDEPKADPAKGTPWFTDISKAVGLDFIHESGATGEWHMPEIMGSGVALFDFDGDGDLDVYFTNGAVRLTGEASPKPPVNRLYRQDSGGRFVDVTDASGLGDASFGMGVAVGDFDNDGDSDVYVTNVGLDRLFRNRGDGTFEDVTRLAGVNVGSWSCSATFLDYDRDGFLDIYVARYLDYDNTQQCRNGVGRRDYCGPNDFERLHDILLHNNGDGTFTDVSGKAGITAVEAPGLGVVAEDFNDDGWIDIYVANDFEANQLWINQKDGTFQDEALLAGCAYDLNGQAESSMGLLAADLNNDARMDLFMTHLGGQTNTAYQNLGGESGFNDATGLWGLAGASVPYTGFGTAALDIELDGDLDLLIANARAFRGDPIPGVTLEPPWNELAEPNLVFINDGSARFTSIREPFAAFCAPIEISHGLATGDIDGDGDLDFVVSNVHGPARIYRNDAPRQGHWLVVRAVDPRYKRDAIGARVIAHFGGNKLVRGITSGFSYLSSSEPLAHFGLGSVDRVDAIEIRWPDGRTERFPATAADQMLTLRRGEGKTGP